jgi:hypothetical protein
MSIDDVALSERAMAPATCGEAIDVPEIVSESEVLLIHDEVMYKSGAIISTQDPVLLKSASAPLTLWVVYRHKISCSG